TCFGSCDGFATRNPESRLSACGRCAGGRDGVGVGGGGVAGWVCLPGGGDGGGVGGDQSDSAVGAGVSECPRAGARRSLDGGYGGARRRPRSQVYGADGCRAVEVAAVPDGLERGGTGRGGLRHDYEGGGGLRKVWECGSMGVWVCRH